MSFDLVSIVSRSRIPHAARARDRYKHAVAEIA